MNTKKEIIEYVREIESFYTKEIMKVTLKARKNIEKSRLKTNLMATKVDQRRELEEIFVDSIKTVKRMIKI